MGPNTSSMNALYFSQIMWRSVAQEAAAQAPQTSFQITPEDELKQGCYEYYTDFGHNRSRFVRLAVKLFPVTGAQTYFINEANKRRSNIYIYVILFKFDYDSSLWLRRSQLALTIDEFFVFESMLKDDSDDNQLNVVLDEIYKKSVETQSFDELPNAQPMHESESEDSDN